MPRNTVCTRMADTNTAPSPLEAAAGAAGSQATTAFKLLSDETRLAILLALWEEYDPYGTDRGMTFSGLYDRVAVRDSANFTYHLDKLTDHFVEKTDDGYKLRNAGLVFVRAIIAGAGINDTVVSPIELGILCNRCGNGRVEISYQNEAVLLNCSECEGFVTDEEYQRGTIAKFWFDPAGVEPRRSPELLVASVIRTENRNRMMEEGVCPECSGPIDASLRLCEEHTLAPGEVCPNCETRDSARVRYVCTVCKYRNRRPVELTVVDHPAVISFLNEHHVDPRWDVDDPDRCIRMMERLWEMEHTLVSTDPVRIHVTIPCEGDRLHLILNEEWDVIDVQEAEGQHH